MAYCPLTATVATAREAKKTSLEKVGREPGKPLLAGSYGIRVAQGLALASGMHTCLHFPEQAALPLREREREGERGGGERTLPGPAP